jgi:hypothetical protein
LGLQITPSPGHFLTVKNTACIYVIPWFEGWNTFLGMEGKNMKKDQQKMPLFLLR